MVDLKYLKRRVWEGCGPTLLDNMGLFTALRMEVSKRTCGRTGLRFAPKKTNRKPK